MGVVACLGIFAKWVKIDCIVFDLKDIYQKVPIVDKMKKIIVYSVVTFAISIINKFRLITELHISFYIILIVYFLCFLYNIFYIIFQFIDICTDNMIEKKMLNLMYQNFWYDDTKIVNREKNNEFYKMQIGYLLRQYTNLSRKNKIKSITNIHYDTNIYYDTNIFQKQRAVRLKIRSTIISLSFIAVWIVIVYFSLKAYNFRYLNLYIIFWGVFIIQYVMLSLFYSPFSTIIVRIIYKKCSYEIQYEKVRKKFSYIYDGRKTGIFTKYINAVRNIMAYAELTKKDDDIRNYFQAECYKLEEDGNNMNVINALLAWIFSDNKEKQLKNIIKNSDAQCRYAIEFIKDCYYMCEKQNTTLIGEKHMSKKKNLKRRSKSDIISIIVLAIIGIILIVTCIFTKDTAYGQLFMELTGVVLGGIFTIVGVIIGLRSEHNRQVEILRLDRMPILAFKTYSVSLVTLGDDQIFSIYKDGICTSGFPGDEPDKLYTGVAVSLANNNPAFNVHIRQAAIEDNFERTDCGANNPLEVRLVGTEELRVMICYMAYSEAVQNGCTMNIPGTIQFGYQDIFGNEYSQDVPVIFSENHGKQNMEIRTVGQGRLL